MPKPRSIAPPFSGAGDEPARSRGGCVGCPEGAQLFAGVIDCCDSKRDWTHSARASLNWKKRKKADAKRVAGADSPHGWNLPAPRVAVPDTPDASTRAGVFHLREASRSTTRANGGDPVFPL